ncbi:hypothetical protein ABE10_12570, partial [Bacillus toyonensis]|nr:hypothetical protein [Bacillus toyonensis]
MSSLSSRVCRGSDVQEADVLGVALDEGPSRLDVLSHQHAEDLVGRRGIVDGHLAERPRGVVHRRLPQLLGVHLAQALVALDAGVLRDPLAVREAVLQQGVALRVGVHVLVRGIGPLQAVERRHREVDEPGLDETAHVAEQQGQQQRGDVLAVDVGVRHQDDLVIARLLQVEVLADARAEGLDHRLDLLV